MPLQIDSIREQFPALSSGAVYLDNPGGTQVPNHTIDRMVDYLITKNSNRGGAFATSQETDLLIEETRASMADFLNAAESAEILFGPNMTSLTFSLSRSLALELDPGDEIIVTHLDHDANITPWTRVAKERGCTVRWLDFDVEDCTLSIDRLDALLNERTRLVALGYASNAVGTVNPVAEITRRARQVGALCFIDAVQFAPHGVIDVQALDCDFLAVSSYKFFGPHLGILYGKRSHLERLDAYKVRPASDVPPGKFETGTQNHEGLAGLLGTLEYLAELGGAYSPEPGTSRGSLSPVRREALHRSMRAIQAYEQNLSIALIERLSALPGIRIWGLTDPEDVDQRVPTVSFTAEGHTPRSIAQRLGETGIYVWDGNYYALAVTERLDVERSGGMVRVGAVHYNTVEEITRLGDALEKILR